MSSPSSSRAFTSLHKETTFDYQEELIFDLVMMPDELPFDFDDFHRELIQFPDHFWAPILIEERKFLR